jgi:cytoskeletal protein CcmA (bactofilin family)
MWKNKSLETEAAGPTDRVPATKSTGIAAAPEAEDETPGSSTRRAPAAPTTFTSDLRSLLGSSLQIKGEISGSEDLQLDCSVEGTIRLAGRKLTVGTNAKIVANIVAAEVVVWGNIKGNLSASDRIEIKKDGSVVGELATSRIMIEDGAYFKGTIAIDRKNPSTAKDIPHTTPPEGPKAALNISGGTPTLYLAAAGAKEHSGN